jgi:hypothetical protein
MRYTRIGCPIPGVAALTMPILVLGGASLVSNSSLQPLHEMTCFSIGAAVECVDSGFVMPPMIVMDPHGEGSDETFIIEDNGGYEEVRG